MPIIIDAIGPQHDRKSFGCGVTALNNFLQHQARQKTLKNIAKTYAAIDLNQPTVILGYYTVTGYSVIAPLSHRNYKNHPHPLAAVKLAHLAVDKAYQRRHLGVRLLIDVIVRTVLVAEQISATGLFVDPKTAESVAFYQQYGFLAVDPDDDSILEMWLPVDTCKEIAAMLD